MSDKKISLPIYRENTNKGLNFINSFLDNVSKRGNNPNEYTTYNFFHMIFYLYLFRKYNINCISTRDDTLENYFLYYINVLNLDLTNSQVVMINKIAECINDGNELLIIPMVITDESTCGGHANVLIYRKKYNQVEHFEPHGKEFMNQSSAVQLAYQDGVRIHLNHFVREINKLVKNSITLLPSRDLCPNIRGLQYLEEMIPIKAFIEENGYCALWSMIYTELCLRNPDLTGREVLEKIYDKLNNQKDGGSEYLRKVARGYALVIENKFKRVFRKIYNKEFNLKRFKSLTFVQKSEITRQIYFFIKMEAMYLNYPDIVAHYSPVHEDERDVIKRHEDFLNLSNSPHSPTSIKNKGNRKILPTTPPLPKTQPHAQPNAKKAVASQQQKQGKELNPKTGRWVNVCKEGFTRRAGDFKCVKNVTVRATSPKPVYIPRINPIPSPTPTPKQIPNNAIHKGKELNPKTGRWVNICPEGKVRNPDTLRCVNSKNVTKKNK
jgi:hypothetical protein